MKIKNKGKVYPSPSSSSSSSSSSTCSNGAAGGGGGGDYLSVLKLLPAAIIALASVLPLEDREVLAYLIMRSMKTTVSSSSSATTNPPSFSQKKPTKKTTSNSSNSGGNVSHKAPGLYCDCFDCYTSFWFRWDSSPNRELIHQAIEAFEDHLTSGESEKSKKNGKGKKRDKTARRLAANDNKQAVDVVPNPGRPDPSVLVKQIEELEESSGSTVLVSTVGVTFPENEVPLLGSPEKKAISAEQNEAPLILNESTPADEPTEEVVQTSMAATSCSTCTHHKGLARKVLPDVLGLFNSRLWSLWSPNA